MNRGDCLFMSFLGLFFLSVSLAIVGVNYNECKIYETMSAAGYEQKIDMTNGYHRVIWVKAKE